MLAPVCDNDTPYLSYNIEVTGTPSTTASITFVNPFGDDVVYFNLPLSGRVLWPGAAVDADGTPTDWPGWTQLADGSWQPGDAFDWARSTLQVIADVNPIGVADRQLPTGHARLRRPTRRVSTRSPRTTTPASSCSRRPPTPPHPTTDGRKQDRTVLFRPSVGGDHRYVLGPMSTRVALVRGINVGGHRSLPMAELRTLLEGLGFDHVRTYIQSGNVVYRTAGRTSNSAAALAREATRISAAINDAKGFEPVVFVLSADAVAAHLAASPFGGDDPSRTFLVFVDGDAAALDPLVTAGREEVEVIDGVIHLRAPDGVGTSKLAARLAASKRPPTTARNLRTMTKLLELAAD